MVGSHDRDHGIGEIYLLKNLRADDRMNFQLIELFLSQPARLRNNVFGNRELSDVVQQRGRPQSIEFIGAEPEFFTHLEGIHLDAPQVFGRSLIFSVDSQ